MTLAFLFLPGMRAVERHPPEVLAAAGPAESPVIPARTVVDGSVASHRS